MFNDLVQDTLKAWKEFYEADDVKNREKFDVALRKLDNKRGCLLSAIQREARKQVTKMEGRL